MTSGPRYSDDLLGRTLRVDIDVQLVTQYYNSLDPYSILRSAICTLCLCLQSSIKVWVMCKQSNWNIWEYKCGITPLSVAPLNTPYYTVSLRLGGAELYKQPTSWVVGACSYGMFEDVHILDHFLTGN